jgi:hypothetical protein
MVNSSMLLGAARGRDHLRMSRPKQPPTCPVPPGTNTLTGLVFPQLCCFTVAFNHNGSPTLYRLLIYYPEGLGVKK